MLYDSSARLLLCSDVDRRRNTSPTIGSHITINNSCGALSSSRSSRPFFHIGFSETSQSFPRLAKIRAPRRFKLDHYGYKI
jgi:hypothetical protein